MIYTELSLHRQTRQPDLVRDEVDIFLVFYLLPRALNSIGLFRRECWIPFTQRGYWDTLLFRAMQRQCITLYCLLHLLYSSSVKKSRTMQLNAAASSDCIQSPQQQQICDRRFESNVRSYWLV